MSGVGPVCPECGTPIRADWDWCHNCDFDPEGRRPLSELTAMPGRAGDAGAVRHQPPRLGQAAPPRSARRWRHREVVLAVLLVALVAGGAGWYLLATRSDDREAVLPERILASDWRSFSPPGGAFSVEVPGEVRTSSEERKVGEGRRPVTFHMATKGNVTVFVAEYTTFGIKDDAALVRAVADGLADAAGGGSVTVDVQPAADPMARFGVAIEGGELRGAVFLRQGVAYALGYSAPAVDVAAFDRFLASFSTGTTAGTTSTIRPTATGVRR